MERKYFALWFGNSYFTQDDKKTVNKLLSQTLDIEKNDLKPAIALNKQPALPPEIPSSLKASIALPLPPITDKATIDKLREQLQELIVQNLLILHSNKESKPDITFTDTVAYRVLVTKEMKIVSYEPISNLSVDLVEKTPLPKLLAKDKETNRLLNEIKEPVAEYKVLISPHGKVEVKWGEPFIH